MLALSLVLISCKKEDEGDGSIYTDFGDYENGEQNYEGYKVDINKDGVSDAWFQYGYYYGQYGGRSVLSVTGLDGWEVFSEDTIASDNIKDVYADTIIYVYRTGQIPVIYSTGDQITDSAYHVPKSYFRYSTWYPSVFGYEYFGCHYGAEIPDDYFYIGLIKPGESLSLAWIKLKIRNSTFILNSSRCYKNVSGIVIK